MNDFVLARFREDSACPSVRDLPDGLVDVLRDVAAARAYDPAVWHDDDSPLTLRAKKDWLRVMLTGAVVVPDGEDAGFLALESVMPWCGMQWLPLFGACYARTRDAFIAVREAMRDCCPGLLTEIAREEYGRVWPGWTDGLDMVHVVMRAEGSFWEPLVTEALERWGGFRVIRPGDRAAPREYAARMALQWLLSFGKTAAGVPLEVLMALCGTVLPAIPDMIDESAGQLRDGRQSRMESGNGAGSSLPSVSESGSVWYDFTGWVPGYTKMSRFDSVPEIDFRELRSERERRTWST